ncbi:MAG TPA: prephenate dehydratase, partial [Bdellovibrionota bacterium]|nr:prephenate dehydratase [Bdellovibrionota bacterium]
MAKARKQKSPKKPEAKPKADPASEISRLRGEIDSVDSQVLALLDRRAGLATEIGEAKRELQARGAAKKFTFYDPEREQRIFERLSASLGSFPRTAVPFVFREIISACRSLEASMKIAFLGPQGTYSQMAANLSFGSSVEYLDRPTISDVFEAVFRRQADYGVVPVENSAEGGVVQTADCLLKTELKIRSELILKIDHYLVGKTRELGSVKRVYSHPAAIAQCRAWLAQNLPGVETIASTSTSAAARSTLTDPQSAAIASRLAAEVMGLEVLRERIQDQSDNATRFVTLAETDGPVTGRDRTSLVVSLKDSRASLLKLLGQFDDAGIEVTRVESRPSSQRSWRYFYFIDFLGHRDERRVARVLSKASRLCESIKVLGSYPRAS